MSSAAVGAHAERPHQEARIPVPAITPIRMQTQFLAKPLGGTQPLGRDRIGRLLHRSEPLVHALSHEAGDAIDTARIHPRHHIDQHQCGQDTLRAHALRQRGGDAAERCPDGDRCRPALVPDRVDYRDDVVGIVAKAVAAVLHPVALAVAALIDGHGGHAAARQPLRRPGPGVVCPPPWTSSTGVPLVPASKTSPASRLPCAFFRCNDRPFMFIPPFVPESRARPACRPCRPPRAHDRAAEYPECAHPASDRRVPGQNPKSRRACRWQ